MFGKLKQVNADRYLLGNCRVLRDRVVDFNLSFRREGCLQSFVLTVRVADLSSRHNIVALAHTEVLSDCSSSVVAFSSAVVFRSAGTCLVSNLVI